MTGRRSRDFLAAAALLLLTSCIQYTPLSEGADFDSSGGTAIVVMGIGIEPLEGSDRTLAPNQLGSFVAAWRPYDPATGRLQSDLDEARFTWRDSGGAFGYGKRFVSLKHFVFELGPGSYVLTRSVKFMSVWGLAKKSLKVFYLDAIEELPDYTYAEGTLIGTSSAPRFSVTAGEVVYIGDFHFGGSVSNTPIKAIEVELDAARAYLRREFPDIGAPLQHRPPTFGRPPPAGSTT